MGSQEAPVAYWNVNVPEADHTATCPDFLANLGEKDRRIVSTPDADYHALSWDRVRDIIRTNHLEVFQRVPSELRRYRAFTWNLSRVHGSVGSFILNHRLGWEAPVRPRGKPFEFDDDVKILHNDWPYGLDPKIVHLVVWTKFRFEENPETGDLSDRARREIEEFMAKTFYPHVPAKQVMWFKNWAALKSVEAVEHFHVMMYDPSPEFVKHITNGDVPQCAKPDV